MSDDQERDPRKCSAKNKKTGEPCGNWSLRGAKTCRFHGSANRRSKKAAVRNVEEAKVQAKLERLANRLGAPIDVDPAQALLDLVASKAGEVEWLRNQIEKLRSDEDLFWGETKVLAKDHPEFGALYERTEEAGQHIVYQLFHKAQDQLVRYASEALKAGVEERQVRVAERTGEQFQSVLTALLTAIDATPDQLRAAAEAIPRILRGIAGGGK